MNRSPIKLTPLPFTLAPERSRPDALPKAVLYNAARDYYYCLPGLIKNAQLVYPGVPYDDLITVIDYVTEIPQTEAARAIFPPTFTVMLPHEVDGSSYQVLHAFCGKHTRAIETHWLFVFFARETDGPPLKYFISGFTIQSSKIKLRRSASQEGFEPTARSGSIALLRKRTAYGILRTPKYLKTREGDLRKLETVAWDIVDDIWARSNDLVQIGKAASFWRGIEMAVEEMDDI